ncbi:hypothetical protein LZ31DRAFT_600488 [Colletotrichum somersetense]|nr:hypothetical protein LZ31DRAFT_600488 [Colletotrichum somersetense]
MLIFETRNGAIIHMMAMKIDGASRVSTFLHISMQFYNVFAVLVTFAAATNALPGEDPAKHIVARDCVSDDDCTSGFCLFGSCAG